MGYISDMAPHSQNRLLQMLDKAKTSVAEGERHLRAQEVLVAEQDRKGRQNAESDKLLRNMREAQSVMVSHVRLLESEIQTDGEATEPASDDGTRALHAKRTRLNANEGRLVVSAKSSLAQSRELLERAAAVLSRQNTAVQAPPTVRPSGATDGQGHDT